MKPQTPKMKRPKRKGHESLNHQNEEAQNRQLKAQKGQPKGSKVTKAGNERKDMNAQARTKANESSSALRAQYSALQNLCSVAQSSAGGPK